MYIKMFKKKEWCGTKHIPNSSKWPAFCTVVPSSGLTHPHVSFGCLPKSMTGPPLLSWNYHSSYFWWPVAELGPYRHFIPGKTPSMTWLCWVVLGLQSPLSNSLGKLILILQECDIITSSHHWMLHQMMSICYQLPSGYVKIAIENEHRNSGFSQL